MYVDADCVHVLHIKAYFQIRLCPRKVNIVLVSGKFRHLPVVEDGEVIAMLDIAKCLYDAISRLDKAAEQGSALAAAVEGVERQLGGNFSGLVL
jgi:hypothetical protein